MTWLWPDCDLTVTWMWPDCDLTVTWPCSARLNPWLEWPVVFVCQCLCVRVYVCMCVRVCVYARMCGCRRGLGSPQEIILWVCQTVPNRVKVVRKVNFTFDCFRGEHDFLWAGVEACTYSILPCPPMGVYVCSGVCVCSRDLVFWSMDHVHGPRGACFIDDGTCSIFYRTCSIVHLLA